MIKKIIYFIERSFDIRDFNRFGVEILQQNSFDVEIWDFSAIFNHNMRSHDLPEHLRKMVHTIRTREEALAAIRALDRTTFIALYITYQVRSYWLFWALSRSSVNYSVDTANAIPPIPRARRSLVRKLLSVSPMHLLDSLFCRVNPRLLGIKPPAFRIAGGEKSVPPDSPEDILWLHTMDYDLYLDNAAKPEDVRLCRGVFLDEYRPYHSDYAMQSITPPTTPEEYYPLLCRFFDRLEKNHGMEIVIAAHPRSEYEKFPEIFGSRSVIKGKTAELVRDAGFVILHSSTSINFLVMYRKPALFITTDSIRNHYEGPYIDTMAALLGKCPINISREQDIDLERELTVNEPAYENYMKQYIKKKGTPDVKYWQQFADHLRAGGFQG